MLTNAIIAGFALLVVGCVVGFIVLICKVANAAVTKGRIARIQSIVGPGYMVRPMARKNGVSIGSSGKWCDLVLNEADFDLPDHELKWRYFGPVTESLNRAAA